MNAKRSSSNFDVISERIQKTITIQNRLSKSNALFISYSVVIELKKCEYNETILNNIKRILKITNDLITSKKLDYTIKPNKNLDVVDLEFISIPNDLLANKRDFETSYLDHTTTNETSELFYHNE